MKTDPPSVVSAQISADTNVRMIDPNERWVVLGIRGGIIETSGTEGVVREISPRGLIKVEHQPMVSLPRFLGRKTPKNVSLLSLRLAGLDVSNAGLTYLSKDVAEGNSDVADADISVKKNFLSRVNVNTDLVRRGYARVFAPADIQHMKALQTNAAYSRLITRLLMSEKVADRRGVIVKTSAVTKLLVLFYEMIRDLVLICGELVRQVYYLAVVLGGYSRNAYRSLGNGVDRLTHFYHNLQKRIKTRALTQSHKKNYGKPAE
uniref:Uncharacterized protein n=1 Tax=Ditylenchus dipsaci TaxID=166011 RepID=A0A915DKR1_9BILA